VQLPVELPAVPADKKAKGARGTAPAASSNGSKPGGAAAAAAAVSKKEAEQLKQQQMVSSVVSLVLKGLVHILCCPMYARSWCLLHNHPARVMLLAS
jgi:hypothetical protein